MTKLRIKVTYEGWLDANLDDEIRKKLESIGADWYAQGTDLRTGDRDLAFDWFLNEEEKGEIDVTE